MNIGQFSQDLIICQFSTQEIIEMVKEVFAEAKISEKCVAWYRHDLRKKGVLPEVVRKGSENV